MVKRGSYHYLMVKPGDAHWSVRASLEGTRSFIESEGFRGMCPAHPLNSYNQQKGSISWKSKDKKGEIKLKY